jgi:hypothetical protein
MSDLRQAAQQALEAMDNCTSEHGHRCNRCDSEVDEGGRVVAALRDALAQQEQDWQDLYRKEKARADMWRDKYESLAGPDERVYPQQEQDTNPHQHAVDDWRLHGGPGETRTAQTPCDIAEDGVCEVIDCCRKPKQAEPVDQTVMELAESVGLIGPASRAHDLHGAIQRFHDLIVMNASIKAAAAFAAPPQRKPLTDEEIERHIGYRLPEYAMRLLLELVNERAHGIGGDDGQA